MQKIKVYLETIKKDAKKDAKKRCNNIMQKWCKKYIE